SCRRRIPATSKSPPCLRKKRGDKGRATPTNLLIRKPGPASAPRVSPQTLRSRSPSRRFAQQNPRRARRSSKISAKEWRKNQERKRNPLWSFDWLTTSSRIFRNQCTSGTAAFKFLLDNKRLTGKMWYKVA